MVESVDNWFTAYEVGETSVEVDKVVVGHVDIAHVITVGSQATGPVSQLIPVRSQGVGGSPNRLEVSCSPAAQSSGTAEPGHGRGVRTNIVAGGYVAGVSPSQAKVSHATPVDGHVNTGGTDLTETSLAYEAALWLEARTRPTSNSVGVQHSEAPATLGLEVRDYEWSDSTHQAFWALLKEAGYKEL